MEFLRSFFVNPGMLAGAGLVAVPIVIYLINRQRYQRVRWAAMEFLLRALRRHQRKIQIQNLLLLLIRVLIILLLALALARPVQRQGRVTVAPDKNRNWIVAVDVSYSMGYRSVGQSLIDEARESVTRLSDVLFQPGDRVALMTLERGPRVLMGPTALTDEGRAKLLQELMDIDLSMGAVDVGASLAVLDELASRFVTPLGEPEPKRILLFSDFQRQDWVTEEGKPVAGASQYLGKLQDEGGELLLARLGSGRERPNLAITELAVSPSLIAEDVWVELRATVRNFGVEDADNIDLSLQVDRDPGDASLEPQLGDVVRVPAGGSLTRVLPYRFEDAGYHTVTAELRSDGLTVDNRRFLALQVAESVRVLLVDGDPASSPIDRETFHVEVALAPEGYDRREAFGRFTPFEPDYVTSDQLGTRRLSDYALVVLANVAEPGREDVDALKRYARAGGAVMVFLGRNVRAEAYNAAFGDDGFLPGTIEGVRGNPRFPVHLEIADATHPVARYFEEHRDTTHIHRPVVAFGRYMQVTGLPADDPAVRVPFRFNDSSGTPAAFDAAYGDGRVLWVTSSADQDWNEFSSWPDFVVFLYEYVTYLVEFGMSSSNLEVGDVFRRVYPSPRYAGEVLLRVPEPAMGDLSGSRNVRKAMRGLGGGNEFEIVHEDTGIPGLYRLDLIRSGIADGDSVEFFAVNVDTREGDLRAITDEDLGLAYDNLRYQVFDASERIQRLEGSQELLRGNEFWPLLLLAVGLLVLAETVLAYLFGRRVR